MKPEHLIQSAKPSVQPDSVFVEQLSHNLQQKFPNVHAPVHHTAKQPWWLWSTLSVGAMAVVISAIAILPNALTPTTQITGYIQKGPFISGSTITVQELDTQLQPTGKTYQVATSSDFGNYALSQKLHSHYIEVTAQGFYYNEVQGTLSSAPLTLHAIVDISQQHSVNVNILTSIASERLRYLVATQHLPFAQAKTQAEQEVLQIFHIANSTTTAFETMDINKSGTSNAELLAVSVLLQGQQTVAQLSELLSKLTLDIEPDGIVDSSSSLLTTIRNNVTQLNTYMIRQNLQQRFTTLGVTATVPDFEPYLQPFATNADPFSYRISLESNTYPVNQTPGATITVTITGTGFERDQETVSLKNLFPAQTVTYIDDHTLKAIFPISTLTSGSYTIIVHNTKTSRTGVTDGEPLETTVGNVSKERLILQNAAPMITSITGNISYLNGGTINVTGKNFTYGTFVWINHWQVPPDAVRVLNSTTIYVDLSPALIANNLALPRNQKLTVTIQTPDFQTSEYSGITIH